MQTQENERPADVKITSGLENKGVQLAKDEEIAQSLRSSVKERLSIDFRKLSVQESQSS